MPQAVAAVSSEEVTEPHLRTVQPVPVQVHVAFRKLQLVLFDVEPDVGIFPVVHRQHGELLARGPAVHLRPGDIPEALYAFAGPDAHQHDTVIHDDGAEVLVVHFAWVMDRRMRPDGEWRRVSYPAIFLPGLPGDPPFIVLQLMEAGNLFEWEAIPVKFHAQI